MSLENGQADAVRDAEPVSRDQILGREREQGNYFPRSADHVQDWQPHPVDPYSVIYICDGHTCSLADIRITVTVLVALLSFPVSSTNEGPRIQQVCPGKTLKLQRIRPFRKNFMFFVNRNTPKKHPTLR